MKKGSRKAVNELRPKHRRSDFGQLVRGKYAARVSAETNVVVLEPEHAEAFPNAKAVNEALRGTSGRRSDHHAPDATLTRRRFGASGVRPDASLGDRSGCEVGEQGNGTAAMEGYAVNGLMENRHRLHHQPLSE